MIKKIQNVDYHLDLLSTLHFCKNFYVSLLCDYIPWGGKDSLKPQTFKLAIDHKFHEFEM